MKKYKHFPVYYFTFLILTCSFMIKTCNSIKDKQIEMEEKNSTLNLSEKYGADEYGMKKYVMAFLYRGPNRDLDSAKTADLQQEHMKNIGKMAEEGKLVLAGPFFGNGDLRGIYIFDVESILEAEELTNSDPAIQAGSLRMELLEWYGSAGLMGVNEIHEKLQTKEIVE